MDGDDIHIPSKEGLQGDDEPKVTPRDTTLIPAEIDHEVEVAGGGIEGAGGGGTEEVEALNAESPTEGGNVVFLVRNESDHDGRSFSDEAVSKFIIHRIRPV